MTTRIVIECIGSRGDVEPYVALGSGLQRAGFDVALATHAEFRDLVCTSGLEHRVVAGDPSEVVRTELGMSWQDSGKNALLMASRLRRLARPTFEEYVRDSEAAVADADVVVFSMLGVAAYHVAEQRGIPAIGAWLAPFSRTSEFASPMIAWMPARLSHVVLEQILWQFIRQQTNEFRETLGLDPLPLLGPYQQLADSQFPVLYGFSPTLVPRPRDWPNHLEVTGAWFRQRSDRLDSELEAFLSAGPPPVYIGFGSRSDQNAERTSDEIGKALRMLGLRAVVSGGWGGLADVEGPDIWSVGETNHQLLFPRCAAVVHHGGAGTTHTAARSGRPSVVVPHWADQFFWADRIAAVGAGPPGLARRKLTADALAIRLDDAISRHANAARSVGESIAAEQGVDNAVKAIERILG